MVEIYKTKYFEKNDNRILEMGTSALSLYKPNKIEELMRFKNAVMENFEIGKKFQRKKIIPMNNCIIVLK